MEKTDEGLIYVTSSLRRIDIMYFLNDVPFARNSEISEICGLHPSYLTRTLQSLQKHNLVASKKVEGKYKVFFLTKEGRNMVKRLREYHGIR